MVDEQKALEIFWSFPIEGSEDGEIDVFGTKVADAPLDFQAEASVEFKNKLNDQLDIETDAAKTLLKNAGHTCGFFTIGGIYDSGFWDDNFAPLSEGLVDDAEILHQSPRAIGFGNYDIVRLDKEEYRVRSYDSYESVKFLENNEEADAPRCHVMAGVMASIMNIVFVDQVYEDVPDVFSEDAYWCEEVKCRSCGDPYCEFVVRKELNHNNDQEPPEEVKEELQ